MEYNEYMAANCGMVRSIAHEKGAIPTISETGISGGYAGQVNQLWYYDEFAQTMSQGNCSKFAYALTWINSNTDSYWLPLHGQIGYKGVQLMAEDTAHIAFADNEIWTRISYEAGYTEA